MKLFTLEPITAIISFDAISYRTYITVSGAIGHYKFPTEEEYAKNKKAFFNSAIGRRNKQKISEVVSEIYAYLNTRISEHADPADYYFRLSLMVEVNKETAEMGGNPSFDVDVFRHIGKIGGKHSDIGKYSMKVVLVDKEKVPLSTIFKKGINKAKQETGLVDFTLYESYQRAPGEIKEKITKGSYYLIIDRGALFAENDGWMPQVKTTEKSRYQIDYVVEYEQKLIGIEVKYGFPKPWDLDQIKEQYDRGLNATFLAYPSDRVGEAIPLIESRKYWKNCGLISLALFRSHCIRKARLRETRYDDYMWKRFFDKEAILNDIEKDPGWHGLTKKHRRHIIVELSKRPEKSILKNENWQFMRLILHLWDIYGYNKFIPWEGNTGLSRKYFEVFKKYPDYPTRLVYAGLITDYSYGQRLHMLAPTDGALLYRQKTEEVLTKRCWRALNKVKNFKSQWKEQRRMKQKEGKSVFFRW